MCGIVGIISLEGDLIDLDVLQRMNDLQAHRGPDGAAFVLGRASSTGYEHIFVQDARAGVSLKGVRVGLGHCRLAILDLSDRGLQPMGSSEGQTWIVFNGEIYNYRELKAELEARGYEFTTGTDTEVLLKAYQQWGEDCLPRLEGMYAFAIWDGARRRLFCARDRLGIKPLYYAAPAGFFLFASEIKALLAFPGLQPELDDDAVMDFLIHGNCDYGARTLLKQVKALPAAHALTVEMDTRQISLQSYWQLEPWSAPGTSDTQRITGLQELLMDTMRKHLNSDVLAGSCLSGGLDSSTVVGLAGKIWHEQPEAAMALGDRFHTFTSCYDTNTEFDERDYAVTVARFVGATSHLVFPAPQDFWASFERMAWHQDMPFSSFSFYAQWSVMRAARETGVKVLLDGQGGDEVFGGYAKFRYAYLASLLRSGRIPRMTHELVATIRQGDRYVLNLRNGHRYLPKNLRGLLQVDSLLKTILKTDWDRAVTAESTPATRWWRHASSHAKRDAASIMQRIQIDDILVDTLPTLLRLEDRSSMAFSMEARVPLLDHKLVEYGVGLPDNLKVQNGWSKFAIRQAMRGLIPDTARLRKSKLGFAAPDRAWLSRDLRGQVMELIHDNLRCSKYIEPIGLRRWYCSPQADTANTESYLGLFRLLSLEMWMRAFQLC